MAEDSAKKLICSICGREIRKNSLSHDAWPWRKETWYGETEGRCCVECNRQYVEPMRSMMSYPTYQRINSTHLYPFYINFINMRIACEKLGKSNKSDKLVPDDNKTEIEIEEKVIETIIKELKEVNMQLDDVYVKISDAYNFDKSQIEKALDNAKKLLQLHDNSSFYKSCQKGICSICGAEIRNLELQSHDAWPARKETWTGETEERCCSRCNAYIVMPLRNFINPLLSDKRRDVADEIIIGPNKKPYVFSKMNYKELEKMLAQTGDDYYYLRHRHFRPLSEQSKKILAKKGIIFHDND